MSAIMNFIERNMEYIEIELIVAFLIDVNLLHKYTHGRDWLYICKKVNYDYCYENTDGQTPSDKLGRRSMYQIKSNEMLNTLIFNIEQTVTKAKEKLSTSVNNTITETYWQIGKYIVETEQDGKIKAAYGKKLLTTLSHELTLRLGKGYSRPNLNNMRKFYLKYPNCQMVSDKLSWSHICELIKLDDDLERSFYERQTVNENWSVRELQRQIDSALFLRLAVSRDKEGILSLAQRGIEVQKPEDVIKSTYTLEFLNLPESSQYTESDLEQRLIDNLQKFLLELGKGFTFVGRQYKITINNVHYHVDLVFYHRILKCFVLIDLKKNSVRHEDIGQMNMYLGYFATEENMPDDNAPIGILMSRNKDELLVEYATYGMDSNLFVSKYELYLPNREDLERLVSNILKDSSGES